MDIILYYINKPFKDYEHLLCHASPERREKVQRIKPDRDKSLALISHLLARHCISEMLNIPFSDVNFNYNEYGKPYIEKDDFHFSVSHSKNLIAFVSHTSPIGIDIEEITDKNAFPHLRFFAPDEQIFLEKHPEQFIKLWTMKEAYVKMLGTGLSTPLSSFNVLSSPINNMFFSTSVSTFQLTVCAEDIPHLHINIKEVI